MATYICRDEGGTAMSRAVLGVSLTIPKRDENRNVEALAHATSSRAGFVTDEDNLALAFIARDQRALADVYRAFAPTLYAVAVRVLGGKQDAEDCVHDTLLRIWSKPNTYCRERGTLSSLLVVAVRNEALSRRRSAARHFEIEQQVEAPILAEDFTTQLRDHVECAKLREALRALAPDLREPIMRAYVHYQTHEQISKELNVPLGTVKSRLVIGLRRLHRELVAGKQRA